VAAVLGALAYAFSPYVVAQVASNPVFLAALALLPAIPAAVIAGATGQVRLRTSVVLVIATAPMLGYVYQNPPLLGMVVGTVLFVPLLCACVSGWAAARRAVLVLALALPLTVAASAYWLIPSILQLTLVAKGQLATISSWSWTEGRATVLNAFWLNNVWGWIYKEYYPFTSTYDILPLSVLKFGPAIIAFAALAVGRKAVASRYRFASEHSALAMLAGTIALALIFLSTGTNPPGNVIFDRLYALPFGWLLREPGRFLMLASLVYAILIAITAQAILGFVMERRLRRLSETVQLRFAFMPQRTWLRMLSEPSFNAFSLALLALLITLPGYPVLTGDMVPDRRPVLPPSHVHVPDYWTEMAAFADSRPMTGAVLVLPPNDFYQMPYSWGYYGNDEFITNLMSRPVLIPSSQSYFPPGAHLLSTIDLTTKSILAGDWQRTDRLLRVLGTPLVLVRGDLDLDLAGHYGRTFASPSALRDALKNSPQFDLVHASGPLELYALRGESIPDVDVVPFYATVNNLTPDLRVLPLLPRGAALVSEQPTLGVPVVVEPPPVSAWRRSDDALVWEFSKDPGWTYKLTPLDSGSSVKAAESSRTLEISVPVTATLEDGTFTKQFSGPVIHCALGVPEPEQPSGAVQPSGGPHDGSFLRLTARSGSACVARSYEWLSRWSGQSIVISISTRHVTGASPHVCLWETRKTGQNRCAPLPPLADTDGWSNFAATTTPDSDTTKLELFLYADVYVPGAPTISDYADPQIVVVPNLPQFDVVGMPVETSRHQQLMVHHSSYSTNWRGPEGSRHVLVNGLLNGWQLEHAQPVSAEYSLAGEVRVAQLISGLAAAATLGLALSLWDWKLGLKLLTRWRPRLLRRTNR
jgi:hypothetical protein